MEIAIGLLGLGLLFLVARRLQDLFSVLSELNSKIPHE